MTSQGDTEGGDTSPRMTDAAEECRSEGRGRCPAARSPAGTMAAAALPLLCCWGGESGDVRAQGSEQQAPGVSRRQIRQDEKAVSSIEEGLLSFSDYQKADPGLLQLWSSRRLGGMGRSP